MRYVVGSNSSSPYKVVEQENHETTLGASFVFSMLLLGLPPAGDVVP